MPRLGPSGTGRRDAIPRQVRADSLLGPAFLMTAWLRTMWCPWLHAGVTFYVHPVTQDARWSLSPRSALIDPTPEEEAVRTLPNPTPEMNSCLTRPDVGQRCMATASALCFRIKSRDPPLICCRHVNR